MIFHSFFIRSADLRGMTRKNVLFATNAKMSSPEHPYPTRVFGQRQLASKVVRHSEYAQELWNLVHCIYCHARNYYGGELKERRNGRAGKRSSKHLKMDNNKSSTKTPQLDSPGKIHMYWIKATCTSRFYELDVSEQRTYFVELTHRLPRHGPADWDKVTKN